ncbi:hypothetical protein U1Q18_038443 [Sarracenia purpurea var. burkii]
MEEWIPITRLNISIPALRVSSVDLVLPSGLSSDRMLLLGAMALACLKYFCSSFGRKGGVGERDMGGGGRGRVVLRDSLGAVLFVCFIWFLFVGALADRMTRTTRITIQPAPKSELQKMIETEKHGVRWDLDPNYVSKRRVPNGPDPIHNRYVYLLDLFAQTHACNTHNYTHMRICRNQ